MKYIDGFRSSAVAPALVARLKTHAAELAKAGRRANIMEICGSHTMAIARYGVRDLLPENVTMVSGPGCPVCVTDPGYIDAAITLAERGAIIVTFGDMLHVPGSKSTLTECRSQGGRIEVCYSPMAALTLAADNPATAVVFLAIGFETTIGPVVSIVDGARRRGIDNVSLLTAFKLVPPALTALLADPDVAIDAFLCPAHVSAIIGSEAYAPFAGPSGVPCVVAGFEPLDILYGIDGIVAQLCAGESRVENQYSRVVKPGGNARARARMDRYLEPVDARWRGIGTIPQSGMGLRDDFHAYDAETKHGVVVEEGRQRPGCLCGDVIKGKCRPPDCPLFATACHPDSAVGPCMVSAEGTCAAYYKYSRL